MGHVIYVLWVRIRGVHVWRGWGGGGCCPITHSLGQLLISNTAVYIVFPIIPKGPATPCNAAHLRWGVLKPLQCHQTRMQYSAMHFPTC